MGKDIYNKKELEFKNGYVRWGDVTVDMPADVALQLCKLDLMVQQFRYLKSQPRACKGPSLDGFVQQSAIEHHRPYETSVETPTIDAKIDEATRYMAELDMLAWSENYNKSVDKFGALLDWVGDDEFFEGTWDKPIDVPALGNILELTLDQIASILHEICYSPIMLSCEL